MLQAFPTKNGTGISIFGDYGDLTSLYATVHEVSLHLKEEDPKTKGQFQVLMNFAYEIRKAYSESRLKEKISYAGNDRKVEYCGFNYVWTDILIFISALRHNAAFVPTTRQDQANMYLLEYVVERALFNYDAEGANAIQNFIGQRINVSSQFVFLIYQALHLRFVDEKGGKTRFRKIPSMLIDFFSEYRPEYKNLMLSLEISAKKEKCEILDLEFDNLSEIIW